MRMFVYICAARALILRSILSEICMNRVNYTINRFSCSSFLASKMFLATYLLGLFMATATSDAPPKLSDTYTAVVDTETTGNIPGLPHGESTYTEYYDYTNKRRRLDFTAGSLEGQTKVYRYQ